MLFWSSVCVCVCVCVYASYLVMSNSLWLQRCSPPSSSPMEFSMQEYWSGETISFSRGDLPDPRIGPDFPALQADSLQSEPLGKLLVVVKSKSQLHWLHCFIYTFSNSIEIPLDFLSKHNCEGLWYRLISDNWCTNERWYHSNGLCIIRDVLVGGDFITQIIESEFMWKFGNQNTLFYTMLCKYSLFRNYFVKFCCCLIAKSYPTLLRSHGLQP